MVYSSLIPGAKRHRIVNSKESNMSIHVVVMGVAGCGKSTVAEAIHERLGYVYAEGDDFHPQANIDKMSAGIPLTDEDRWPWLNVINSWMVAREALDENTVVSSSALKRSYREVLAKDVPHSSFISTAATSSFSRGSANARDISCHPRYCQASSPFLSRSPPKRTAWKSPSKAASTKWSTVPSKR